MVARKRLAGTEAYAFVLRPNCSMSWRALVWFFTITCLLSMTIAIGFSFMGAWMIFPFAGLEMLALGAVLYICASRATRCELIEIDDRQVTVSKGRYQPAERLEFERQWARVWIRPSGHDWYPSELLIRSHGREVEVGGFLDEEERQGLAGRLAEILHCNEEAVLPRLTLAH